ncbi:Nucleolar complex protein 4-like protein [Trichoplax sp. H2]|nr:Nucleolar complex protein 4-like protein [Trichoplax sp. H2]|eukprot:RDD46432.1 Nucleolar complex protein 4-like protein [Trichoplax sp. H2]
MVKRNQRCKETASNTVKKKRTSKLNQIEDIQLKTEQIFSDQEKINLLVDILDYCQSTDHRTIEAAVRALAKLFSHFVANGDCINSENRSDDSENKDDKEMINRNCSKIYYNWMHKQYLTCQRYFIALMQDADSNIQELVLNFLMTFVSDEFKAKQSLNQVNHVFEFPNMLFYRILEAVILSDKTDDKSLIKKLSSFFKYSDITYYTLKNIGTLAALKLDDASKPINETFVENVFYLLRSIKLYNYDEEISSFYLATSNLENSINDDYYGKLKELKEYKKVFSKAWLNFLRLKLPMKVYKKALAVLHTDVIPNMLNPKLLIDFLTDSYNIGGTISLLALNGLFILIHQHNLDYPDFYAKLYALVEASAFVAKSSGSHLPAYVVAAFAKKLSRIALTLNPASAMVAIAFICNLIKRHDSIKILIHQSLNGKRKVSIINILVKINPSEQVPGDPYLFYEEDPAKCKAIESSLWELQALMDHYYPGVTSLTEIFKKPITQTEIDISEYTDQTLKMLLDKELHSEIPKNPALEFKSPSGIIPSGSEIWKFWSNSQKK